MKYIAHRGASVEAQENTRDAIRLAAKLGAYACECDLRKTADSQIVLFHDNSLKRLTGASSLVKDLTVSQMRELLRTADKALTLFCELSAEDLGNSFVLCDIGNDGWECDDAFFAMLRSAPVRVICGVHQVAEAHLASKYFPPEQILAFMQGDTVSLAKEFFEAGAGIIRLWENQLDRITPADLKCACPDAEVWIMSHDPKTKHNGSEESLAKLERLGADGVLLNDIRLAIEYDKK